MKKRIFPHFVLTLPDLTKRKGFREKGKPCFMLVLFFLLAACSASHESAKKIPDSDTTSNSPYYYYLESRNRLSHNRPLEALGFLRHAVALDSESVFLYQELTAVLVGTGQLDAALQSIERAWELDPEDEQTLLAMAGIRQMLGHDIGEIIPLYEKVLQLDPDQESVYFLLGNLYFNEKEPEKAEAVYREFIAKNPENPNGYYYLGQLLSLLDRNREALSNFDKAIAKAPGLLEPKLDRLKVFRKELEHSLKVLVQPGDTINGLLGAHFGTASPALRKQVLALNPSLKTTEHLEKNTSIILPPEKGNPLVGKIRKAYEDLLRNPPHSSELLMEYSLFLWKTGEEARAKKLLAPLASGPENRDNSLSMIHALLDKNGNYRDAIFLLSAMRDVLPDDFLLLYHMGLLYDEAGMETEARKLYQQVPAENPVYVPVLKHLAHMDLRAGDIERGIARLETAWHMDETDFYTCSFLADVRAGEGRLENAEKLFYACLDLNPTSRDTRYRLGTVLHKQGKTDEAIREMEILIREYPEDAHALNFLGYTLTEENKRLDEAEEMIRKAIALAPDDGYILDSMGWICMKQGKLAEALFYLEKAVGLVADDAVLWDHLGDVYRRREEMEKAREAYTRSLSLKQDPRVMEKIKTLEQKAGAKSLP